MAEFTFGQVEAVLASAYEIADHKRVAFAGRLKILLKNGLLDRTGPGRGKAGSYSFSQLLQLALAIEFLQAGITPQRAVTLVRCNWLHLLEEVLSALDQLALRRVKEDISENHLLGLPWAWFVPLMELSELSDQDQEGSVVINALPLSNWMTRGKPFFGKPRPFLLHLPHRRSLVIDPGYFLSEIIHQIVDRHRFAETSDLILEFEDLEEGLREASHEFAQWISNGVAPITEDEKRRADLKEKIFATNRSDKTVDQLGGLARMATYAIDFGAQNEIVLIALENGELSIPGVIKYKSDPRSRTQLIDFGLIEDAGNGIVHITSVGRAYLKLGFIQPEGASDVSSEA